MNRIDFIPDRRQRELAETTFDRNVVVIAGAGTGKTTLLVNRLIHLLIKEPSPVPINRIVALTFTNKAATEMKIRLHERLSALIQPAGEPTGPANGGAISLQRLRERYRISTEEINRRAMAALDDLEKAQIGTLHSFAAHLLRLHPLESALDPAFQEDDGSRFEEHFTTTWDVWIDRELGRQGEHHALWRTILRTTTVESLRILARALCNELVDLGTLAFQLETARLDPAILEWLKDMRTHTEQLLDQYRQPKRRKVDEMLASATALFTLLLERGGGGQEFLPAEDRAWLSKETGSIVAGWEKSDFKQAARLIQYAKELLTVDHTYFIDLLKLLVPLVTEIRASFAARGWLSFDGLLARAHTLLRDHPVVRRRVKQEYLAVLVDEFQDTDPVQYEIILAVSEQQGHHSAAWQDMPLEPGKLFVVGDPKQSIYAFRRADIEAFDRVVQKIDSEQGTVLTLTTNFRSDATVIEPVNEVFDRLFRRRLHVQPSNVHLEADPCRPPSPLKTGVRFQLAGPRKDEEPFDAGGATRAESEVLARWLKEDILCRPSVRPGHVGLLFRKLTQADFYLDALRRYGIPYVIEGEKHFYRRQEVIDLINVLRVLANPHDVVALTGILRAPLGGLTDRELYELRQAGYFNLLQSETLESWSHPRSTMVRRLYRRLAELHHEVAVLTLPEVIQLVFDRLDLLNLAAASLHGEQAVANLLKVKHAAIGLANRPHMTLSGFVDVMVTRVDEQPDEAESPLAEESLEAVHVLTIHKAKGLEFPIVILPGLHQQTGRERSLPAVAHDWSSGQYGLTLGDRRTFGSILSQEKLTVREEAERCRVLYVGMTRAKHVLVLSGGVTVRSVGETVLGMLQEIGEGELGSPETQALKIGASLIPQQVIEAPDRKRPTVLSGGPGLSPIDPGAIATLWQARTSNWAKANRTLRHLTPTELDETLDTRSGGPRWAGHDRDHSRWVGILAHRILERWDYTQDPVRLFDRIPPTVLTWLSGDEPTSLSKVTDSLKELFGSFIRSKLYGRLATATILGREIPFIMPWNEEQVMEGVIDLIYRLDGRIWIGDYKTDQVTATETQDRAGLYHHQATVYRIAASRCLNIPSVSFEFLFLRPCVRVEVA